MDSKHKVRSLITTESRGIHIEALIMQVKIICLYFREQFKRLSSSTFSCRNEWSDCILTGEIAVRAHNEGDER